MKRWVAVAVAFSLAGCGGSSRDDGPWVELAGERFGVEIADDEAERARGLMFRDQLGSGRGMLFIHDRQEPLAFWMKDTRIPLDILYFDNELSLVSQQRNVPPCTQSDACPRYPSVAPARFVLELNAGSAARLALTDGTRLRLGSGIPPR